MKQTLQIWSVIFIKRKNLLLIWIVLGESLLKFFSHQALPSLSIYAIKASRYQNWWQQQGPKR
jgi:hypothetical protein